MKRLVMIIFTLLLIVGCSNESTSNKENDNVTSNNTNEEASVLEAIKEAGVIQVGTEGTYAPFSYHDDSGKLTGYDIEVMEEVAKRLGVEATFNETQWDAIFAGLDAGRFDVIANQVGINEERIEKYDFSTPYTYSNAVLLIHEDDKDAITSYKDMDGKLAAQTLTSNYGDTAKSYGATLEKIDGFNQAVDLIISKRADGTFNDKISALDFVQQRPDAPIHIIDEEVDQSENAFAFRKGETDLVDAFNDILQEMKEDGTLTEISEKWFGEDVS